jgi:arginase family enzyme
MGIDVVEVSPPLDAGGMTALLGAHVLLTALAGLHAAGRSRVAVDTLRT